MTLITNLKMIEMFWRASICSNLDKAVDFDDYQFFCLRSFFLAFYQLYIGASKTVRIKEGRDADSYYKDGNDDQQRVVQRFLPPWGRHGEPLLLLATILEVATMHTEHYAHYAHRTELCNYAPRCLR